MTDFDALPGVYNALFLYIEPGNLSTYQPLLFPLIPKNVSLHHLASFPHLAHTRRCLVSS